MIIDQMKYNAGWIDALRGGEYRQGFDRLQDSVGFCCLGVACDLSGKGFWENEDGDAIYVIEYNGGSVLWGSYPAYDWLNKLSGLLEGPGRDNDPSSTVCFYGQLAIMNDQKEPFTIIADTIERRCEIVHPGWRQELEHETNS